MSMTLWLHELDVRQMEITDVQQLYQWLMNANRYLTTSWYSSYIFYSSSQASLSSPPPPPPLTPRMYVYTYVCMNNTRARARALSLSHTHTTSIFESD